MPSAAQKNGSYMEVNEQDISLFEGFFEQQLKAKEMKHFSQRLKDDSEFRIEWEYYHSTRLALNQLGSGVLKEQLANQQPQLQKTRPYQPAKQRAWRRFFKRLIIFSGLVLGTYALFYSLGGSSYNKAPIIIGAPNDYYLPSEPDIEPITDPVLDTIPEIELSELTDSIPPPVNPDIRYETGIIPLDINSNRAIQVSSTDEDMGIQNELEE